MAAMDVVGAVGADDDEAAAAQGPEEVGEEVAGGGVRPVQVLQDEDDGPVGRDAFQEANGQFEEAGGAELVVAVTAGLAELGEQPGQFALLAGAGGGHLLGQGAAQGAQGGGEGGVRQALGADLDAAADGDDGVAAGRDGQELLHEAGLADAGLAADEQGLGRAEEPSGGAGGFLGGAGERAGERVEFAGAADEHGAD